MAVRSGDVTDAPSFFWSPAAIGYLAEALLAATLAGYLGLRAIRDWRQKRLTAPTLLLAVMMATLVLAFLASLLRVLTAGGWISYAMPWSPQDAWTTLAMPWAAPFGGVSAAGLAVFAYRFPQPLPGARREAIVVAVLGAAFVVAEMVMAIGADLAILDSRAWWRPAWMPAWMVLSVVWAAVVLCRQLVHAQIGADGVTPSWRKGVAAVFRAPANREATAARGFLIFTILPIVHTSTLLAPGGGPFGVLPLDVVLNWSVLAQLVGFALVLVGYMPERSSFVFKLTVISLALVLGVINGAAWIVEPVARTLSQPPGQVMSGNALRFTPGDESHYRMRPVSFGPDALRGEAVTAEDGRVDLPYPITFYGRRYDRVFVDALGSIGFERTPRPVDAAFPRGGQPAIHPLLVERPDAGGRIYARAYVDRLVVTRVDRCGAEPERCYTVQTVVHHDGVVDVHYIHTPTTAEYRLLDPIHAPWLIGMTPGPDAPVAARPLTRDYYGVFLSKISDLIAPFVAYIIVASLAVVLIMPVLYQGFLVRPLNRLLEGLRRFRGGRLDTRLAVSFNDEVGYLTESFNEMTRAQQALVEDLEQRIADRVAEIGDITVRNAQLEERNRLSADLHDAVAQTLSSASMLANALSARLRGVSTTGVDTAERIAQLNRHALQELRLLLEELRDSRDGDWLLTDRLSDLVNAFQSLHTLTVSCEFGGESPLPKDVRTVFFRVAQESLNNVVKHSGASEARIAFEGLKRSALLVVSDNGRGFDPDELFAKGRLGLAIMRDRARQVGAALEIESRPGEGARITLIWTQPDVG